MEYNHSDITIINNKKVYKLNKIVLERSEYFERIFNGKFKEANDNVLYTEFNEKCWERFIRDIYSWKDIDIFNNFD